MVDLNLRRKPSGAWRDFVHRIAVGIVGAVLITFVALLLDGDGRPGETMDPTDPNTVQQALGAHDVDL